MRRSQSKRVPLWISNSSDILAICVPDRANRFSRMLSGEEHFRSCWERKLACFLSIRLSRCSVICSTIILAIIFATRGSEQISRHLSHCSFSESSWSPHSCTHWEMSQILRIYRLMEFNWENIKSGGFTSFDRTNGKDNFICSEKKFLSAYYVDLQSTWDGNFPDVVWLKALTKYSYLFVLLTIRDGNYRLHPWSRDRNTYDDISDWNHYCFANYNDDKILRLSGSKFQQSISSDKIPLQNDKLNYAYKYSLTSCSRWLLFEMRKIIFTLPDHISEP